MAQLIFVRREDSEFDLMFKTLFEIHGDHSCPSTGEVWQYMGSHMIDGSFQHEFRHRSYKGERKYARIAPTPSFLEENSSNILTK